MQGPLMKPSNYLENKTPSATYWRVHLVCKKVQAHSSLEPPMQYNQEKCYEQKVCDKKCDKQEVISSEMVLLILN